MYKKVSDFLFTVTCLEELNEAVDGSDNLGA